MAKRSIGIDVGASGVRVVQIARNGHDVCIEKVFTTQTRRETDSTPQILRTLFAQDGFDWRADIAVAVPYSSVFLKEIEIGSSADEGRSETAHRDQVDLLPIEADQVVTQTLPAGAGDRTRTVLVATSRQAIEQQLQVLEQAHLDAKRVDGAVFATYATIRANYPQLTDETSILAFVDEYGLNLTVVEHGQVRIVRSIPVKVTSDLSEHDRLDQLAKTFRREIGITCQRALRPAVPCSVKIYLVIETYDRDRLHNLLKQNSPHDIVFVDPTGAFRCTGDAPESAPICVALGLALRCVGVDESPGVNFLKNYRRRTAPLNLKKEIAACAALAIGIFVVWVLGLFLNLWALESEHADVTGRIRELFLETCPDERNIVNPTVQLQQKLDALEKDERLASFSPEAQRPLDLLFNLSRSAPPDAQITVHEMTVTPPSARVSGTCRSFESVYEWREQLQQIPTVAFVDVQDVQKRADADAVQFVLLLSCERNYE